MGEEHGRRKYKNRRTERLEGKIKFDFFPALLHPQADFQWKGKNNLEVCAYKNTHTHTIYDKVQSCNLQISTDAYVTGVMWKYFSVPVYF